MSQADYDEKRLNDEKMLDAAQADIAAVQAWLAEYGDKDIVAIRVINITGKGRDVLRQMWRSLPTGVNNFPGVDVVCGDVQFVVDCVCGGAHVLSDVPEGPREEDCPACGGSGWHDVSLRGSGDGATSAG